MASAWYNKGKYQVLSGGVDLNSDDIKVILVTTSYSFDVDHNFISDVSSNELSVSGYTGGFSGSGRKTLSGKSFTEDDSSDLAYFDATDLVWSALGVGATIGGAILVKEITNDGDSPLIAYMDLTDTATNGGDITVSWNASGLLRAL